MRIAHSGYSVWRSPLVECVHRDGGHQTTETPMTDHGRIALPDTRTYATGPDRLGWHSVAGVLVQRPLPNVEGWWGRALTPAPSGHRCSSSTSRSELLAVPVRRRESGRFTSSTSGSVGPTVPARGRRLPLSGPPRIELPVFLRSASHIRWYLVVLANYETLRR